MGKDYKIYKITSPSGGVYIGLTKMTIEKRFSSHINRGKTRHKKHPLYDCMKKYNFVGFLVEEIESHLSKDTASQKEKYYIKKYREAGYKVYNVSDGGETDGKIGGKIFWESINADPKEREAYIEKLSCIKKANDHTDYNMLQEKALEWRKKNPKEAYLNSRRARRIASKKRGTRFKTDFGNKVRVYNEKIHAQESRIRALAQWRDRTEEEKKLVADKIRRAILVKYEDPEVKKANAEQLIEARKNINHELRKQKQREAIQKYWEDLRNNPEAYAAKKEKCREAYIKGKIKKENISGASS